MSDGDEQRMEAYMEMMKDLPKWPSDLMLFGQEIFHVTENSIRQIPVMSKEGQELLNKFDNGAVGN